MPRLHQLRARDIFTDKFTDIFTDGYGDGFTDGYGDGFTDLLLQLV